MNATSRSVLPSAQSVEQRAAVHAALGEPVRLALADALLASDRSPKELAERCGLPTNLLAHHLDVMESVGLIERLVSEGDRRRRYVRLCRGPLRGLNPAAGPARGRALFVCSHNSARSQLAAALWRARTGEPADSAGTHPASAVHPGAVSAASRAGLDLRQASPRLLRDGETAPVVVTVCDRAHEELTPDGSWWHWSIADPVPAGSGRAFDAVVADLEARIEGLIAPPAASSGDLRTGSVGGRAGSAGGAR